MTTARAAFLGSRLYPRGMEPDQGVLAGPVVESSPAACPSCGAPWPPRAGHRRVSWEHCHGCSGARHGGHRTRICLTCWTEHFDAPCDRLGGGRTRKVAGRR